MKTQKERIIRKLKKKQFNVKLNPKLTKTLNQKLKRYKMDEK